MEFTLANKNFERIGVIDTYISAIWTDRFDEAGDFEFVFPMNATIIPLLQYDYYVFNSDSDRVMYIKDMNIETDVESGDRLVVTGYSLERILDRRIIRNKLGFAAEYLPDNTTIYPNLQNGIHKILKDNIIEPVGSPNGARRIPNFKIKVNEDLHIKSLIFQAQYFGDNIYDVVTTLCKSNNIGYKITLEEATDKQASQCDYDLVFELICGTDRGFNQYKNYINWLEDYYTKEGKTKDELERDAHLAERIPHVIFSREYDNLLSTSYHCSLENFKNVAIVAGQVDKDKTDDEPTDESLNGNVEGLSTVPVNRVIIEVGGDEIIGLDRREIFANAEDITVEADHYTELVEQQYQAQLRQRGIDSLMENSRVRAIDGEVDATQLYKYGEDFKIGDIVQIIDPYGNEGEMYVTEFIMSLDVTGYKAYPTFMAINKGEYDE